jgi:hypothetical protein
MDMSNFYDNLMKSVVGAVAALAVTWVTSYGFVESTKYVHAGVKTSSVMVAAFRN